MTDALLQTDLPGIKKIHQGKVRDLYEIEDKLLLVATDRLSAFYVIMSRGIPGKGEMLTQISNFWFARTAHLVPNHLTGAAVDALLPDAADPALYARRAIVPRRLRPVPVDAIARG